MTGRVASCPECGGAWLSERGGCVHSWCDAYARPDTAARVCNIDACDRPARGRVPGPPAHVCRQCDVHPCQLDAYLTTMGEAP